VQGFQADPKVYRQLGAVLGHEVARIALALGSVPARMTLREVIPSGAPLGSYEVQFDALPGGPVQFCATEISLPLRAELPEKQTAAAKLDHWKNRLNTARANQDHAAITEAIYMARRADIQLRMADDFGGRTNAGVRTHVVSFGDVAMVGCNIEPFCEIGLAIKQQSPFPVTFMCGYTNGSHGLHADSRRVGEGRLRSRELALWPGRGGGVAEGNYHPAEDAAPQNGLNREWTCMAATYLGVPSGSGRRLTLQGCYIRVRAGLEGQLPA
jgi:hypothetical protein